MGKTLRKYLLKNFWSTIIMLFTTFIFLLFFADLLDNLDNFIKSKLPLKQYFLYYLYTIPIMLTVCLPITVLLATMRLFRNLSLYHEYTALIVGGISLKTMLKPILASAILLSILSFYVNDRFAPISRFKRKIMQREKFKVKLKVIENKNIMAPDGRMYYIDTYYKEVKGIKSLMVTEVDAAGKILFRIFAETAFWSDDNGWSGQKVKIQPYRLNGLPGKPRYEETMNFGKVFKPEDILISKDKPKFLELKKLRRMIRSIPDSKPKVKASLRVDYYRRYATALLPIVIVFIAIPFSIAPVRNVSSKTLSFGIVLCLIYYLVDASFCQAGKGLLIDPALAAWMANIIFTSLGLMLLVRVPH